MRRKAVDDIFCGSLFDNIPEAFPQTPGAWRFRGEIAHAMGEAIRTCVKDIYQISADMSRLLGREVSVNTLYKYTSEASEDHIPNFETAIAFDAATENLALASLFAEKLGCRVLPGKETLYTELGRLEQMKADIARQEKAIKKLLGDKF